MFKTQQKVEKTKRRNTQADKGLKSGKIGSTKTMGNSSKASFVDEKS